MPQHNLLHSQGFQEVHQPLVFLPWPGLAPVQRRRTANRSAGGGSEVEAFVEEHAAERGARGRRAVVCNDYLPSREVLTGDGPISVRVPLIREGSGADRCFRSKLLPRYLYLKKERLVEAVLLSLRDRGVKAAMPAVGDGGLGFWSALADVYPETQAQRCWVPKTANVLDKLPKRL